MKHIPFNKPLSLKNQLLHLNSVINQESFSASGIYNKKCSKLLQEISHCKKVFLTPSATSALEFSALLCNLQPGDEVIVPSFTHVATANAFVRFGAEIVWCDIDPITKNIDHIQLAQLITQKTKAFVAVHYGGISSNLTALRKLADENNLFFIEDNAMSLGATYEGKPLGSFGDVATVSFHETKNIQCGEGGAILINNPLLLHRARVIHDQGTNRYEFLQGVLPHYSWIESSSNYYISELQAAFLFPQLEKIKEITDRRKNLWDRYYKTLRAILPIQMLPTVQDKFLQNYHMFYLVANSANERIELAETLKQNGIDAHFHYQPLHRAPFWKNRYNNLSLPVTEGVAKRLLRLPLYFMLTPEEIDYICLIIKKFYQEL